MHDSNGLKYTLIVFTILVGVGRFFIEPRLNIPTSTGFYEALAHIHVGLLIGIWLAKRKEPGNLARLCFWQMIAITVLEIVMFAIQKNA